MKNEWHFLAKIFNDISEGEVAFSVLRGGSFFKKGQELLDNDNQIYVLEEDKDLVYQEFFERLNLTLIVDNNSSGRKITITKKE